MTETEKNEVVGRVLSAIRTNSLSIGQLTPVTELEAGDCFEVSGGRRIAYEALAALLDLPDEDRQKLDTAYDRSAAAKAAADSAKELADSLDMIVGEMNLEDIDSVPSIGKMKGRLLSVRTAASRRTQGWLLNMSCLGGEAIHQAFITYLPLTEEGAISADHSDNGALHAYKRVHNIGRDYLALASGELVGRGEWSRWEDVGGDALLAAIARAKGEMREMLDDFAADAADAMAVARVFDKVERENLLWLSQHNLSVLQDNGLHIVIDPDGRGLKAWHDREGYVSEFSFMQAIETGKEHTVMFDAENYVAVEKMTCTAASGTYFGSSFTELAGGRVRGRISPAGNSSGTVYISVKLKAGMAMSEADALVLRDGKICEGGTCDPDYVLKEEAVPASLRPDAEDEHAAKTTIPQSALSMSKRISREMSVGDRMIFDTAQWRGIAAFKIPSGAKGAWVCGTHDAAYPRWAVATMEGTAAKIAERDSAGTNENRGYYVSFAGIPDAHRLYVEVSPTADSATAYWDYGEGDAICPGEMVKAAMSANAIDTGLASHGMGVRRVRLSASSPSVTWTLPNAASGRSLGVWLRMPQFDGVGSMPQFYASLSKGGEAVGVTELESSQVLQMGQWLLLKIRTCDMDADKVTLRGVFSSSSAEAVLEVGDSVICGHFERPAVVMNFDQSWAATDACGAYDALIAGNVPFTITGAISAAEAKLKEAYRAGLLDAGSYGGPTNGTEITGYTSLSGNIEALYERIEAQLAQGFGIPTSYGGGGHVVTPLAARALRIAGYTCVKGGVLGGVNIAASGDPGILCVSGSVDTAMQLGGTSVYFAHGVSSNPARETNPAMYVTADSFMEMLAEAKGHRASGGCRLMSMRQWAEMMQERCNGAK